MFGGLQRPHATAEICYFRFLGKKNCSSVIFLPIMGIWRASENPPVQRVQWDLPLQVWNPWILESMGLESTDIMGPPVHIYFPQYIIITHYAELASGSYLFCIFFICFILLIFFFLRLHRGRGKRRHKMPQNVMKRSCLNDIAEKPVKSLETESGTL